MRCIKFSFLYRAFILQHHIPKFTFVDYRNIICAKATYFTKTNNFGNKISIPSYAPFHHKHLSTTLMKSDFPGKKILNEEETKYKNIKKKNYSISVNFHLQMNSYCMAFLLISLILRDNTFANYNHQIHLREKFKLFF